MQAPNNMEKVTKETKQIEVDQNEPLVTDANNNKIPLGIGSLVCLRSGSSPMTVTGVDTVNNIVVATSYTQQQGYITLTLPIASLQPYRG